MPRSDAVTESLERLRADLGYRRLRRSWAKAEIFLGLLAAGAGLLLGFRAVGRAEVAWEAAAGGLLLFVLGAYLAMAGHRSHLYQSNAELAAYLASLVERR